MGKSSLSLLQAGIAHGYINASVEAEQGWVPELLVNDSSRGTKVLSSIINELNDCDEFLFSVAFITESGVAVLLNALSELESKGIHGKILASQYQSFTAPKALKRLLGFSNIELRILTEDVVCMHTKGYIFRKGDMYSAIIGSSNMTQNALCANAEWNLKINSHENGSIVSNLVNEFNVLYSLATIVTPQWIDEYNVVFESQKKLNEKVDELYPENAFSGRFIEPNKMQYAALASLAAMRKAGAEKALVISATGTGKTYLSAFDVKAFKPKRFLFVVHREIIAKDAMKSFRKVIGNEVSMGVMSGGYNPNTDYIFAMLQTMSMDHILNSFAPDAFDYIVFDEVHRAGSPTYQKIFRHFKPKFLLGMSATPERSDGFDIFKMFDYNIAYEIRLQQAMADRMVCPFHYFGISELEVDGEVIDDVTEFNNLVSEQRVDHIIERAEFYGYSGPRLRGLVFCRNREETIALAEMFNQRGYRSCALLGMNSQSERERAIERLEQNEYEGGLDYIFTVDIFNEGVDIPSVNQVIMLRPTQSSIIFVQQLGRGLRNNASKEYVIVLDFIGNYQNNFMIPIALSGDRTYNKDTIRRFVAEGSRVIPGCSTISFDKVTRERIYSAIDRANFNDSKLLKDSYIQLKQRLGRIPKMIDFDTYGSVDIMRIIDKNLSYYSFLKKVEKEYSVELTEKEKKYIDFLASTYASGKRPQELEFLKLLLSGDKNAVSSFKILMRTKYPAIRITDQTIVSITNQFMQCYVSGTAAGTYRDIPIIEKSGADYSIASSFAECIENPEFAQQVQEIIEFGLHRNKTLYADRYSDTNFVLYSKYTYADVCRGLDWEKSEVALNIGGYK